MLLPWFPDPRWASSTLTMLRTYMYKSHCRWVKTTTRGFFRNCTNKIHSGTRLFSLTLYIESGCKRIRIRSLSRRRWRNQKRWVRLRQRIRRFMNNFFFWNISTGKSMTTSWITTLGGLNKERFRKCIKNKQEKLLNSVFVNQTWHFTQVKWHNWVIFKYGGNSTKT